MSTVSTVLSWLRMPLDSRCFVASMTSLLAFESRSGGHSSYVRTNPADGWYSSLTSARAVLLVFFLQVPSAWSRVWASMRVDLPVAGRPDRMVVKQSGKKRWNDERYMLCITDVSRPLTPHPYENLYVPDSIHRCSAFSCTLEDDSPHA